MQAFLNQNPATVVLRGFDFTRTVQDVNRHFEVCHTGAALYLILSKYPKVSDRQNRVFTIDTGLSVKQPKRCDKGNFPALERHLNLKSKTSNPC